MLHCNRKRHSTIIWQINHAMNVIGHHNDIHTNNPRFVGLDGAVFFQHHPSRSIQMHLTITDTTKQVTAFIGYDSDEINTLRIIIKAFPSHLLAFMSVNVVIPHSVFYRLNGITYRLGTRYFISVGHGVFISVGHGVFISVGHGVFILCAAGAGLVPALK